MAKALFFTLQGDHMGKWMDMLKTDNISAPAKEWVAKVAKGIHPLPDPLSKVWQLHVVRVLKEVWPRYTPLSFIAEQLHVTEGQIRPLVSLLLTNRIIMQLGEGYRVSDYIQGNTRKRLVQLEDLTELQQERLAIMRQDGIVAEHEALEIVANSITAQNILSEFPGSFVARMTADPGTQGENLNKKGVKNVDSRFGKERS